ncbi:MAG: hypothetical protein F2837_05310 [Actinobacteria bacterium]|uniref:Unannotated protein n=1 Tax=freshwater metagenome TaxID=449393 RepID=A0A6J7J2Y4_9ZZZZ|nr:hypothetical protein [Actinomycetota bacterium]
MDEFTSWTWLGGETRWLANIPLMYQALSAPTAGREFVRAPQSGEDFLDSNRFAYWGSLLHLLTMHFGWQYPALGMRWWIDQGQPTDDDRFALIKQTWCADGQFDAFLAYLWAMPSRAWPDSQLGPGVPSPYAVSTRVPSDEPLAAREWIAQMDAKFFEEFRVGGLHLEGHIPFLMFPADSGSQDNSCELILDSLGGPRGTLIAENLREWYSYLHQSEVLQAPHSSGRSWRIDVVVKPVGYLGTYRRSRDTGRWFAGPHHHHIVGNYI